MKELEALHRRSPERRRRTRMLRREEEARGAYFAKRYYGLSTAIYQTERCIQKWLDTEHEHARRLNQTGEYLWKVGGVVVTTY